jgi:hypothetical protein
MTVPKASARSRRSVAARVVAIVLLILPAGVTRAAGADQYAMIITGATGRSEYALKYQSWRTSLRTLLRVRFQYPDDHIIVLAEEEPGPRQPTAENVRAAFAELAKRAKPDDVIAVLLTGHGTIGAGDEAKFNLVGPDLTIDQWAALVQTLPGRMVFVNAASGSFPFLQKLSKPGRIVITSTATPLQEYETVFP